MSVWKQLLLLCLLGGLGYGGWVFYEEHYAPAEEAAADRPNPPAPVEIVTAERQTLETSVEAVGTTRARQSVEIVPEAAGRIVEITFTPGDRVAQGEVLVRLDDTIQRADLTEAEARSTEQEQVLARARQLRETNAISQATLEESVARLAEAGAQLDRARRRLEDRTITAPFAGVVGLTEIDPGARVSEGDLITRLDDLSEVIVEFALPETLFAQVGTGLAVTATSAAFPDRIFEGRIAAVDSRIDPVSRSFLTRAIIPNRNSVLPAGMFMSLTLTLSESEELVVPEAAIIFQAAETYVFTVTDGTAHRVPVKTGQRRAGLVAIEGGLKAGTGVVVRGLQRVRDGAAVTVLNEGDSSGTTNAEGDFLTLPDIAVRRPVLAAVASLLLLVFGLAALRAIPVRELPDVDNAVVSIDTIYVGAAPEVIDTDITEPIEGAVAAINGLRSISSESRQGRSRITLEFDTGRDIEQAANDVRDAVGRVSSRLPEEAQDPRVIKSDADADPVMRLAVTSSRMTTAEITDYIDRFISDRLATIDGIANLQIYGERPFAVRIWLDRRALAARQLTVADVESALRRNNIELPAGEVVSKDRQLSVRLNSRLRSVDDFRDVVLDRVAGYPVRLGDVARVEPGVADDSTIVRTNGSDAVGIAILRQSQSNTLAISQGVRAEIERLQPTLPEGMDIIIGSDDALFVGASIREVLTALFISLGLVVLVILLFLRSFRATLVPFVAIPVSLIGSFILIGAWGFSLNTLTLLAMLLAIGLVVDDAIVVLENIQRRIENGETPLVASLRGAKQVTFAVIATSLTLIAVFVPLSFMPGQVGRLFVEFGWVMAGTVAISTFVALSACPALASRVLKSGSGLKREDGQLTGIQAAYYRLLQRAVQMPLVVLALAIAITGGAALFYEGLPRELAPSEDRGVGFVPLTAPQGSTVEHTDLAARQVEEILEPLREEGLIDTVFTFTGWGNRAFRSFVVFRLVPWEERTASISDVVGRIVPQMSQVTIARGFPVTPAGLGLRGNSTPVRVVIGGPDFDSVKEWATTLLERSESIPGLVNPEINFEENLPQLDVSIARNRADDLGISIDTIANTLQTMLASREVTTFVSRGREYPVILQAAEVDRESPSDINNLFIRAADGKTLVPLGALVTMNENAAAPSLRRFDRLPSIQLSGTVGPGHNLGTVLEGVEAVANDILPASAKLGYEGQSRTFKDTSEGVGIVLLLALLIVFLVLAAQFESFVHPLTIMLTVPAGLAGAIYAMALGGLSLNVYSQIGIILLVGLVAKNGILIVEFANQLRDEGMKRREAVLRASALRLRPIVMTVLSTVLGALPLVVASGAGAESRAAIGTVIIAGLLLASVLMLVVTPVLYDLLARFTKPRGAFERLINRELSKPATQAANG